MAELLLRVVDKVNTSDFYKDCELGKRGFVVTVRENGWTWQVKDLTEPYWRIVRFINLPVSDAMVFEAPEVNQNPESPSKTLQRRQFKLDIDHNAIPQNIKTWLADDTRVQPILESDLPRDTIMNTLRKINPPIEDPSVLGPSPRIIG